MSPQAENAFAEMKARLARRPREADVWDMNDPTTRRHMLKKSYRRRRAESNTPALVPAPTPAMLDASWDEMSEAERNIARIAVRPYCQWAESLAGGPAAS